MIKRADIILKGRVQKAGFRDYIDEVAYDLDIKGWVKNLEDNTVKIVCEGKSNSLDKFITRIQIKEYPIRVEEAIVEFSPALGEFNDFTIIREEDIVHATYERMDAAGRYMREMNRNLGGKFDKMLDKQDQMLDKQDQMLGKQDLHIEITRNGFDDIKEEIKTGFHDVKNEIKDVRNEIHMQRDDFKEVFMKEVSELHNEINEIRSTLARMQAAG
ncbi:MAG: acylphosphatase [Candidatus Methanoperedens sp.]|nr:acylphosphatase [Candidatus Methanoperedens sp.]